MSRRHATLLGLLVATVLSGVTAQAALAEGTWWIAKSPFKGVAELATSTKVVANFKLEMHGEGILFTIECKTVKLKSAKIENSTERKDESDVLEGCSAVGKSECTVATSASKPLKAVIEGSTGAFKLKFAPQSGTEIGEWSVSGATCKEKGKYHADGTMICNYKGVETEAVSHPLEFTTSSGSKVTVGGVSSTFTLTYEDELASAKTWSVQ